MYLPMAVGEMAGRAGWSGWPSVWHQCGDSGRKALPRSRILDALFKKQKIKETNNSNRE